MNDAINSTIIWPYDFCVENNNIWMIHGDINVIFRYDYFKEKTEYENVIPLKNIFKKHMFTSIHYYDHKLFLIPLRADIIMIYHINEKRFTRLKMPIEPLSMYFQETASLGKYLYCFPCVGNSHIIKIDMEKQIIEKDILVNYDYKNQNINGICEHNGNLICPIYPTNRCLILDTTTDEIKIKSFGDEKNNFNTIICLNNTVYIHSFDSSCIYKIDIEDGSYEKEIDIKKDKFIFAGTIGDKLLIEFQQSKEKLLVDLKTKKIKNSFEDLGVLHREYDYDYGVLKKYKDEIFYFNRTNNVLYKVKGNECEKKYIWLKDDRFDELLKQNTEGLIAESSVFNLQRFISNI